jgi:hypothetical protein
MRLTTAFKRKLAQRCTARTPPHPADASVAFALTQLLIDSGHADAVGCIVVATWRRDAQTVFEVICPQHTRAPVAQVLAGVLARPFHDPSACLLTQREALQLIAQASGTAVEP